jgi:hypothetical protein
LSVYLRSGAANDLLVIGELDVELKNGKSVRGEFCAHCVIDDATLEDAPKFSLYQVWTVSTIVYPFSLGEPRVMSLPCIRRKIQFSNAAKDPTPMQQAMKD